MILETGRAAGLTADQLGELAVEMGIADEQQVQATLSAIGIVEAWDDGLITQGEFIESTALLSEADALLDENQQIATTSGDELTKAQEDQMAANTEAAVIALALTDRMGEVGSSYNLVKDAEEGATGAYNENVDAINAGVSSINTNRDAVSNLAKALGISEQEALALKDQLRELSAQKVTIDFKFNIPSMPSFQDRGPSGGQGGVAMASGGTLSGGGFIAGEFGPEMITGVNSGRVLSSPATQRILSREGNTTTNNFNLTTNSLTRPSGLALEFQSMGMAAP